MKQGVRIALMFIGSIIAVGFPFIFNWENGGVALKTITSLAVAVVAAAIGWANLEGYNSTGFDLKPKGVEVAGFVVVLVISVLVILGHIAQW